MVAAASGMSAKERLAAKKAAKAAASGKEVKPDEAEVEAEGAEPEAEAKAKAKAEVDDKKDTKETKQELDLTFENTSAGASLTFPMQCSSLRKNGFVVIKGRPCKIIDMSTSKTGKHGHAKVNIVATDIFTQKKYEDVSPSTHNMDVPIVGRKEYQFIDFSEDDFLQLLTGDGDLKEDIQLAKGTPLRTKIDELRADGEGEIYVIIQSAMGEEAAMEAKKVQSGKDL